jgi:hypothetical protein
MKTIHKDGAPLKIFAGGKTAEKKRRTRSTTGTKPNKKTGERKSK